MEQNLLLPIVNMQLHDLLELLGAKVEATPIQVLIVRDPADGAFDTVGLTVCSLHNPLEYTYILTEAGPGKRSVGILTEPVDPKDAWWVVDLTPKLQPVVEVVAHVVAGKGKHREGITAHHTLLTKSCSRRL